MHYRRKMHEQWSNVLATSDNAIESTVLLSQQCCRPSVPHGVDSFERLLVNVMLPLSIIVDFHLDAFKAVVSIVE